MHVIGFAHSVRPMGDVDEFRRAALMKMLSTGCQWCYVLRGRPPPPAIPRGFTWHNLWPASPKSTHYDYFDLWTYDGTLGNIHHALYVKCGEQIGPLLMVVYI